MWDDIQWEFMNGLYILMLPAMNNVWVLLGVSLVFVLVLGSLPVDLLYTGVLNLIAFILIKKDKTVRDEGLEEEYDSEYDEYELLLRTQGKCGQDDCYLELQN